MPDSGSWYGTVGWKEGGGWGSEFAYTQGAPKRTADPAAKSKRIAARKRKRKTVKASRKANRRG